MKSSVVGGGRSETGGKGEDPKSKGDADLWYMGGIERQERMEGILKMRRMQAKGLDPIIAVEAIQ